MAISPISVRAAYNRVAAPHDQREISKKTDATTAIADVAATSYQRTTPSNVAPQAQEQKSVSSSAAVVFAQSSKPREVPADKAEVVESTKVSSLLADDPEVETDKPSQIEIEKYAQRYLVAIQDPAKGKDYEARVKGLVSFYGGTPDRAGRFKQLVQDLESGQEGAPAPTAEVAIA